MEKMTVKLTFVEEVLGTASSNPDIHSEYIASKAPDAKSKEEEVAALGVEAVEEKGITVFPRTENDIPFMWDYQVKGFMKDTCSMMKKVAGSESSKCKAFKKEIDGLIFVDQRKIPFDIPEGAAMGDCQRPLRASTPQGERVALAHSETVPAGTTITFTVTCLVDADMKMVREWLDYGILRGMGQWRNSGKGRFTWEEIKNA